VSEGRKAVLPVMSCHKPVPSVALPKRVVSIPVNLLVHWFPDLLSENLFLTWPDFFTIQEIKIRDFFLFVKDQFTWYLQKEASTVLANATLCFSSALWDSLLKPFPTLADNAVHFYKQL
jgi:hypothetical protein